MRQRGCNPTIHVCAALGLCLALLLFSASTAYTGEALPAPDARQGASPDPSKTAPAAGGDIVGQIQSRDVIIRDHRGAVGQLVPPPLSPPDSPIIRDHRRKSDLVGRKTSTAGCGPGRIGTARVEVKNQGVATSGAFFTSVTSFNKQSRVRTGPLPPGGAFTHQVPVGCPPQGPCPVNGIVDVDREVAESNETNNGLSFVCQ